MENPGTEQTENGQLWKDIIWKITILKRKNMKMMIPERNGLKKDNSEKETSEKGRKHLTNVNSDKEKSGKEQF